MTDAITRLREFAEGNSFIFNVDEARAVLDELARVRAELATEQERRVKFGLDLAFKNKECLNIIQQNADLCAQVNKLRAELEAARHLLYEADQIACLIEPDFTLWREKYASFGGRDDTTHPR